MKAVDKDGNEVAQGQEGELLIRGHNVMKGYYKKPEETAKTVVDGWLHTGDIVRFDEEGYVYVVDRLKEVIIRGGYNIYPRDIEETFMTHPAVHQIAVIGIPHKSLVKKLRPLLCSKKTLRLAKKSLLTGVKSV